MKFDGWVSLQLDNRVRVDNAREPWTIASVGELLTEGRKKAMMDGKGHIQGDLKQKAKEANLAQVINSEVPRITFNYFTMYNIAWFLLTDLKRASTAEVGPEFLNYIPSEDQLPFVVGYVFSTTSGHGSDVRKPGVGMTGSSTWPWKSWASSYTRVKGGSSRRRGRQRLSRRKSRM
ncbi:hypothetical protein J7337_004759 [Fusarium musae]|uniref:Uncharacterized protein n=1 Tax=Fusarium musae TaxID=1042133 RepID=A0A9P8DNL0_9HYPO|nr:hypothetical protein J7337_004759 [Fusarium musae]KAG9504781.1 hypothetical protein J7337_004759 [Fusarium musae]